MAPEFLWQAFVTLLVIIDPFAVLPVFINLTRNEEKAVKVRTAKRATLIAAILLLVFAFLGDKLLDVMNITEPAFRIAGGFLLLLAAIDMVVAGHGGIRSPTGDETREAIHRPDISVFPLAIPLIAGPGALVSTVVLMRQAEPFGLFYQGSIILLLSVVMMITYMCLRLGDRLMKLLGLTGVNVLTRVFGIILAGLAVQNMINGVVMIVKNLMHA